MTNNSNVQPTVMTRSDEDWAMGFNQRGSLPDAVSADAAPYEEAGLKVVVEACAPGNKKIMLQVHVVVYAITGIAHK